jgi:signal transduction histidine kinase
MKNSHAGSGTRPWPLSWTVRGAILVIILIGSVWLILSTAALSEGLVAPLFVGLGVLITLRKPENRIGWLLIFISIVIVISGYARAAVSGIDAAPATVTPWLFAVSAINTYSWAGVLLPIIVLLYIFPTGRLLTRRWRWMPWLTVSVAALFAVSSVFQPEIGPYLSWQIMNPVGMPYTDLTWSAGFLGLLVMTVGGITAITLRFRRSAHAGRTQIKLVLVTTALSAVSFYALIAFDASTRVTSVLTLIVTVSIVAVPISITIAIVRHNLFDIDVVISKTVTYGILAVFITAVYALVVVGVGTLLGGGDEPSLALSIVAVAIVAVAFEPVRNRLQRWANRLVFGERATPYEVLSQATARLAGTGSPEEALKQVTQLVVDGAGASEAVLWLKVGANLQPCSATPMEALIELADVSIIDRDLPDLPGEQSVLIRHRGDILGALTISKARGESVNATDEKMLDDVAAGTGLLLRNIGLNAELTERAEQLHKSRRRLVAAHDAERHRLERDLHDGAQQQVVAVKVKLGLARTLSEREGADDVTAIVAALADDTQDAVDAMRAVAHGIYPPLLETEGLGVALATLGRSFSIPIELATDGLERYPRSLEETIYFCLYEIANTAVDAGATSVAISLVGEPDGVTFTARHDGSSDDPVSVEDRVEAFGGSVVVTRNSAEWVISGYMPTGQAQEHFDGSVEGGSEVADRPVSGHFLQAQVPS